MSYGLIPLDDNDKPVMALWDDTTETAIPVHLKSKVQGVDGKWYALIDISATIANANSNGQATMANSAPVTLASDQTPLPVKRNAVSLFSTAQNAVGSGNSGDITVGPYTEISIDITTTAQAGTSPTIQFFYERKGVDGNYYPLWQSAVLSAASNVISTSIGAGMAYNQSLGITGHLRWSVTGTGATWTFTPNITGK